jgi:hypothetical protein
MAAHHMLRTAMESKVAAVVMYLRQRLSPLNTDHQEGDPWSFSALFKDRSYLLKVSREFLEDTEAVDIAARMDALGAGELLEQVGPAKAVMVTRQRAEPVDRS